MNHVFRITAKAIIFLRHISVDIVLGAIGGLYFASHIFKHKPSVYYYITLVSAVWVIYIVDHILDGIRTKTESDNYEFHFRHRKILLFFGILLILISFCFVLFYLEKELITFGISTFILVIVYQVLNFIFRNKHAFFPKEILISALYTWGIFGGIILMNGGINPIQLILTVTYFLVVCVNVLLFAYAEINEGKNEGYNIISTKIGKKKTRILTVSIAVISIVFSLISGFLFSTWKESVVLNLMSLTLLMIIVFPSLIKSKYFGLIADSVLIYPLVLLLFN